jgi:hypothetical protein
MSDDFTEISSQSIFERIGNSTKRVLFGIILVPAAVVLLFWNEGRAVQTAKSLKEGASIVVSISPDKIDPVNEKKLVHFTDEAETSATDGRCHLKAGSPAKLIREMSNGAKIQRCAGLLLRRRRAESFSRGIGILNLSSPVTAPDHDSPAQGRRTATKPARPCRRGHTQF